MKPRLLDLFCGAGGAGMGYHRAGFEVVGVDIEQQRRYPFEFVQADALSFPLDGFDVIHASPPCQAYTHMRLCRPERAAEYPALIEPVRERLEEWGGRYVIENVVTAPLKDPMVLCGRMFGLELYRHRLFESNTTLLGITHLPHDKPASRAGHWKPGTIMSVAGHFAPLSVAQDSMGIHWMRRNELREAIPPVYTDFIGQQLLEELS